MSPLVTELQDAAKAASHRVRAALGQAGGVVPVVRLEGPIAAPAMSGGLGRGTLNLAGVESVLRRAFETDDAVAVALVLNSPGGSPAQSELIATRIRQLAAKHELPVLDHAFPRYAEYIPGGAPSTPANPSNTKAPEGHSEGGH